MSPASVSLQKIFFDHGGKTFDKWEQYLGIYSRELAPFVASGRPIRLLEIGVQNGSSLEMWLKYLSDGLEVVGIDIDPRVQNLNFNGAVTVHIADINDTVKVEAALGSAIVDVIIDDGSHMSGDIVKGFRSLYARLAPGGKFIVEDLHASYWASYDGRLRHGSSSIEFFKGLVHAVNADHFHEGGGLSEDAIEELPQFSKSVARLSFYDSVVVVEKLMTEKTRAYQRMLSGSEAEIVEALTLEAAGNPRCWLS